MASRMISKGAVIASAAGLLIAGGGAIAYAAAGESTPSATSTASSSASSGLPGPTDRESGTPGKGGMGRGGHSHTPVTGAELTKVTEAIKGEDSAVTVTVVVKDEDGSYDAFGTKAGAPVRIEVSADLKTIEVSAGGMGRGGMGRGDHSHTPVTGAELTKVTEAIKGEDSAVTVTVVVKDEDGSYDAFGTKAGAPVRIEVSADLKTIEVGAGGMGRGGKGHHGPGMPGQGGTLPLPTPSATTSATT